MENSEFVDTVYREQLFQQALNQELAKLTEDTIFYQTGIARSQSREVYLNEFQLFNKDTNVMVHMKISAEDLQQLNELHQKNPSLFKEKLKSLLIASDQDMIGIHVRASGPQGLKNAELRAWASEKLPVLLQNLNKSQSLTIK